jgi:titin
MTFDSIGLVTGATYFFKMTASNEVGEGVSSAASGIICATVPGKPFDIKFTQDSSSSLVVSWRPPVDDGGSPITRYEVWFGLLGTGELVDKLIWSGADIYSSVLNFPVGVGYRIQVAAVNAVTQTYRLSGTRSDEKTWYSALFAEAPKIDVASSLPSSISLSWSAPTETGGLTVTGYKIYMADVGTSIFNLVYHGTTAASTTYTQTELQTGLPYQFKALTITSKGDGPMGDAIQAYACGIPGAVGNFRVVNRTSGSIKFSWDAPAEPGGCAIIGYTLFGGTSSSTLIEIGRTPSVQDTTFTFFAWQPGYWILLQGLC